MKKFTFCLTTLIATAGAPLLAQPAPMSGNGQMQSSDCSQLTQDEQNFADQIIDMNSRMMFCSQFTYQQRQQAMQLMGQPGASGNMMNADQAVQQVMGSSSGMPMAKPKPSRGGCPVQ